MAVETVCAVAHVK